ncbi:MAG: hypothetical protein KAR11_03685 [Phycisphaerae bacterium]|nr:hypothetical protein [Phycisphaerae bacterium]
MPIPLMESIHKTQKLPRTDSVLMGRAELLAPGDRDLIEAVLIRSQPTVSLGRIMNVDPRRIRRRVHRLGKRIISKKFLDAARSLAYLGEPEAKLARLYYCQGIPQRKLAAQLEMSPHQLRRKLDKLSAEITAISRMRQGGQIPRSDCA